MPTPNYWINGGDLGGAAVTIWCVMVGKVQSDGMFPTNGEIYKYTIPKHTGSFYRCYKLLKLFPKWRNRLSEVAEHFPEWKPFVRDWDNLTKIVEQNPMSKEDNEDGEDYRNEQLRVALLNLYRESKHPEKYSVKPQTEVKKELPKPTTNPPSYSMGTQPKLDIKPQEIKPSVQPIEPTTNKKYFGE